MSTILKYAMMSVAALLCACSSGPKQETDFNEERVEPALERRFNSGLAALEAEEYTKAAEIFDAILVENPASEFDLIALYNSGAAYEGLKQCKTAGRRYRQVAQYAANRYPRVEAQALFRLSYVYECVGHIEKVISSLTDVLRRKDYMPEEIALAEVPARLAAAYAKLGQIEMAKKYFSQAEQGVQQLRRLYSERRDLNNVLARTYYFMGRVQERQEGEVQPQAFFQSLRFQQTYLIKAVEMGGDPWARRAGDAVLEAYSSMWKNMESGRTKREKLAYVEKRAYVLSWVEGAKQALLELKTLRFPGAREGAEARRMFSQLEVEEGRIERFLADFAVSHPLTPEAEKREGLKREGRVKSAPTSLEKVNTKK